MTNQERQAKFESMWADRHSVPVESMEQYRFKDVDGYRLPDMAAHYRTFCAAMELFEAEFPSINITDCVFDGVNLDGSLPLQIEKNERGVPRLVAIDMRGWTCLAPSPTVPREPDDLDIELPPNVTRLH